MRWGCSLKGWNCCVDKAVPVRPYDMLRLRHALSAPASALADDVVHFAWNPQNGTLIGSLAHRPYEQGRRACIFLEEITNLDARAIRDNDPARFASLPDRVQRAAGSTYDGELRVAALCRAHQNRPEVCRGFPFQRFVEPHAAGGPSVEVKQTHRCGSCALSTVTTAREIFESESAGEYWRALDAYWPVENYLLSMGAANISHPEYRRLPAERSLAIWRGLYLADDQPAVAERFPEQWRADLDIAGDREIFRLLLLGALDAVDALVEQSGEDPLDLGFSGEAWERPDIDPLLDPARPLLAPPPAPHIRRAA